MFITEEKLSEFEYEEAIRSFQYVRAGVQPSFPQGYFNTKGGLKLKAMMEHYFYEERKLTRDEASQLVTFLTIKELKLENAVKSVYGTKRREGLFEVLFPEKKIWELPVLGRDAWTEDVKKEFAIWFVEEYLGLNKDNVFDNLDIHKAKNISDPIISRVARKFTGLNDIISTAYDWDKQEVKSKVLGIKNTCTIRPPKKNTPTTNPNYDVLLDADPEEYYNHIAMLYYLPENGILGCYVVGGNTEEEIEKKAIAMAEEEGATKYWLEKLN